jgi:hypothetical protein
MELYKAAGLCLERDLALHIENGFVYIEPGRMIMGRPFDPEDPGRWDRGAGVAWFVALAVGEGAMDWFLRQMPWYLPRVAWYRRFDKPGGGLHVWDTDRLIKRIRRI